jgi:hypothetical protein
MPNESVGKQARQHLHPIIERKHFIHICTHVNGLIESTFLSGNANKSADSAGKDIWHTNKHTNHGHGKIPSRFPYQTAAASGTPTTRSYVCFSVQPQKKVNGSRIRRMGLFSVQTESHLAFPRNNDQHLPNHGTFPLSTRDLSDIRTIRLYQNIRKARQTAVVIHQVIQGPTPNPNPPSNHHRNTRSKKKTKPLFGIDTH